MTNNKSKKIQTLALCVAAVSATGISHGSSVITKNINLHAWTGSSDTEVTYSGDTWNTDVIITSDQACDLENYTVCDDALSASLSRFLNTSVTITDTATRLDQTGYYNFISGSTVAQIPLAANSIRRAPSGAGQTTFGMTGLYTYVIGGNSFDSTPNMSVWRSIDKLNWVELPVDENSAFTPRALAQVLTTPYGYLMTGGVGTEVTDPAVLRANFGQETYWVADQESNLTKAEFHQMTSFGGQMLIIGGTIQLDNLDIVPGIIASQDGTNWTPVNADHSFEF